MTTVLSHIDAQGVATVTLNRADKHNALNGELVDELTQCLLALNIDTRVRAVVLTGSGRSFCAGADIAHMATMLRATALENRADALKLARCLQTLNELHHPVIAYINGNVFGGGLGLVACADIAIAHPAAEFALTEVRLGIVPAVVSPYVVAAIGARQARRLFLTAARFDAKTAESLGLVHRVAASEAIAEEVALLLQGSPQAIRAAKQLVRMVENSQGGGREELREKTAELLADLRASTEGQEGLLAFLERRKASWIG